MSADPITTLVKLAAESENPHQLITLAAADRKLLNTIKKLCTQPMNPTSRNWVHISELCLSNKITPEQFQESLQLVARILGLVEYEENYYQILGIDPSATREEIKQAFRRLSLSCHPDTNPDDPGAAERFRTLHRAYQALSDDRLRRQYDRHLNAPVWSEKSVETPEKHGRFSLWKWGRTWQIGALVAALLIAVFLVDYQEWQAERYYTSKSKKGATAAVRNDAAKPAETPAATTQTALENQRREIDKLRVAALNSKPEPAAPSATAPEPKQESAGAEPTKTKVPLKEPEPKQQVAAEPAKEKPSPPVPEAKPDKIPAVEKPAPTVLASSEPVKNKPVPDEPKRQIVAAPPPEPVKEKSAAPAPEPSKTKVPSKEPEPKQQVSAEPAKEKSSPPVREAKPDKIPAVEKAAPTVLAASSEPVKNKSVPDKTERQMAAVPPPEPHPVRKAELKPPTPVVAVQESKEAGEVSEQDMERRIRSFLAGYVHTYQQMNAAALLVFFEKDALENGQPIRDLVPVYRENFRKAEKLSYRIDLRKWTESGEGVQVDGTFRLRVKFRGEEDPVESAGSIQLALIRKGDQFRVQRLDYRFRNVE